MMTKADQKDLTGLRESEEKYRKMIELASDSIFTVDPDSGEILEVNRKALEVTGYSEEELVGKQVWELHPLDQKDISIELYDTVKKTGEGYCPDLRMIRKDGSMVNVEIMASLIEYGDKKVIQRICRDITGRLKLQRENSHLRKYYESVLDMMPVGLGVRRNVDRNPEIEFENKKIRELFKVANLECCPYRWQSQGNIHDQVDPAKLRQDCVCHQEKRFPNGLVYEFATNYFRDPDGSWREVNIVTDISERVRLEDQLRESNELLERRVMERTRELQQKQTQLVQSEKMAALGNLVAGVAHEINTPLGALHSNNDLFIRSIQKIKTIIDDPSCPEEVREDEKLNKIFESIDNLTGINKSAALRIIHIVNSLRNFARLDQAEMDRVDIHQGIEDTLTLVHHQIKGRIEIEKDFGDLPKISCYPNQLNQVFMNILVNAGQAIEEKGRITIRTFKKDDNAVIEFEDNGRGIEPDKLSRIFDPGFTTKGAGVGTGLGLSIVHQIIQDHKGKIDVESVPGKGTKFIITLPTGN